MRANLLLAIVLFPALSFAQNIDTDYFIDQLKDNSNKQVFTRIAVHDSIGKLDTVSLVTFINQLEQAVSHSSPKLKTRVAALRARLFFYKLIPGDSLYAAEMKAALYKAYELQEPFMIAEYSRWYSEMLFTLDKKTEAVQYAFNSIVLQFV